MKTCSSCKEAKALVEFNRLTKSPDGYKSYCRLCAKSAAKEYNSRAEVKAAKKAYHDNKMENDPAYRAKRLSYMKEYNHSEAGLAGRQEYVEENRYKVRKTKAEWDKRNPWAVAAKHARRRQRVENAMSSKDKLKSSLYRKKIADDPCYYCKATHQFMEWDHLYPLSLGGTDHWWNIVRACRPCNRTKTGKKASAWMASK